MSGACDVTDRSTPYDACALFDCVRVRESYLSLYTFLSKILSRTALVVTTSVISIRLNHKRRHFGYRLEFGSQPQVFSQGELEIWEFGRLWFVQHQHTAAQGILYKIMLNVNRRSDS